MNDQVPPSAETDSSTESGSSQVSYAETPYKLAEYEVIGSISKEQKFEPLAIESFAHAASIADPMFADYGGIPASDIAQRWHLPEHLAREAAQQINREVEEVEDHTIHLQPEELEQIKVQAREEGRVIAREEITAENNEKLAQIESRVGQMIEDLTTQLNERVQAVERDALDLALSISNKVINFAVEINPEYILPVISEALASAGGASISRVRISAEDMEFIELFGVRKHLKEHDGTWGFEIDETVRSGCIVDTSAGEVDFQLDSAWERIKENVVKLIK